jgi:hypothetical protein
LAVSGTKRFFFNGASSEFELTEVWLPKVRLGATDFRLQKGLAAEDNAYCGLSFDGVVGITGLG